MDRSGSRSASQPAGVGLAYDMHTDFFTWTIVWNENELSGNKGHKSNRGGHEHALSSEPSQLLTKKVIQRQSYESGLDIFKAM